MQLYSYIAACICVIITNLAGTFQQNTSDITWTPLVTFPQTSIPAIPETSIQAIPQTSTPAIPQTSIQAIPQTSIQAIPQTSTPAIPQTSIQAIPQTSIQAIPQTSTPAIPQTSIQVIPQTSIQAIPQTSTPAISQTSIQAIPQTATPAISPTTNPASQQTATLASTQTATAGITSTAPAAMTTAPALATVAPAASVQVGMVLKSEIYTNTLSDLNTPDSKALIIKVCDPLTKVVKKNPSSQVEKCSVVSFSPGSVITVASLSFNASNLTRNQLQTAVNDAIVADINDTSSQLRNAFPDLNFIGVDKFTLATSPTFACPKTCEISQQSGSNNYTCKIPSGVGTYSWYYNGTTLTDQTLYNIPDISGFTCSASSLDTNKTACPTVNCTYVKQSPPSTTPSLPLGAILGGTFGGVAGVAVIAAIVALFASGGAGAGGAGGAGSVAASVASLFKSSPPSTASDAGSDDESDKKSVKSSASSLPEAPPDVDQQPRGQFIGQYLINNGTPMAYSNFYGHCSGQKPVMFGQGWAVKQPSYLYNFPSECNK